MSQKTVLAPALCTVPAVAKNVNGVVTTSSPPPMSGARRARRSASGERARTGRGVGCVGAARAADGELGVTELGDRFFELLDGRAKDEELVIDHAHHRADHFILDQGVLGAEVEKRDGHMIADFRMQSAECTSTENR